MASPGFEPDERQRQAIEHVHGPMLVVAGAGTGKTTVLTQRLARLIEEGHARPDEILALTYTDNAAQEMRERVRELVGAGIQGLQVETFHAYCNNLLIRHGQKFEVLEDQDLWIHLRKRIRELHLNYFVRAAKVSKFLDDLLAFMRRCQDELVGPDQYAEYVKRVERRELPIPRVSKSKDAHTLSDEEVLERCREISSVFARVEGMLREQNLGTFGHMITRAYELLDRDASVLQQAQAKARFLLADEFQDANLAQVKILKKLAGGEQNVFAVGDPDQAIYRFRGASSGAFELFRHYFPETKLAVLGQNRRSTTAILQSAYALISKNPDFLLKAPGAPAHRSPLTSARDESAAKRGKEPSAVRVETVVLGLKDVECGDLIATLRDRKRKLKCHWRDFAVLYRSHLHPDQLAVELADEGIPFTIQDMDVRDTPEVRDLLACVGAVVADNDSASLLRVAALPQFGVHPDEIRAGIKGLPRGEEDSGMAIVLSRIDGGPAVLQAVREVRDQIAQSEADSYAAMQIIMGYFRLDASSPAVSAVLEFVRKWEGKPITRTRKLGELVEYLEYFPEAHGVICLPASNEDAVRLMTAHAAKGLEFDHVFVIRANSGSFPSSYHEPLFEFPAELRDPDSRALLDDDKELHRQEERRLFYVAMTRARDSLTLYAKRGRGKDPLPDGFLRELLKDSSLARWLRQRPARAFQPDLFGCAPAHTSSRSTEWLSLPPAFDLSAKLSASAVQTYETCPLQFKLEREWRIPGEVPAAMQYGAVIHLVLRSYYDSVRRGTPLSEEALHEVFSENLAAAGMTDPYQFELYRRQGYEQLRDFLVAAGRSPAPQVVHTEESFQVRIGDVTIVGRIDRMDKVSDEGILITDYKTGKPQAQEDADKSLQLSIYAVAAQQKWGYQVERLCFYNLEGNSPVFTERSALQLKEAELKVESVAKKIASGQFEAKIGFHCGFCAYRSLCPATEKRLYSIASAAHSD